MPEKVFLGYKASIWGIITGWVQIVLCILKLFLLLDDFVKLYHRNVRNPPNYHKYKELSKPERAGDNSIDQISHFAVEIDEFSGPGHGILIIFLEIGLLSLGFIVALVMGVILIKGCKQRHVPFLKAWLIFALISIFWHILYVGLSTTDNSSWVDMFMTTELILLVSSYIFGIWITYGLVTTILAEQNRGGEGLPKYEGLQEQTIPQNESSSHM